MEVEGKHPKTEEDKGHGEVTIESSKECRHQKVILEKPYVEMMRHIKPLYVRVHLNGRLVSKVLIDNGSAVNVMPLRMLRALGGSISDLIKIEVVMSAFTREVSKTLRIPPIDITIGNKTSLYAFFVIDSTKERLDSCQLMCVVLSSPVLTILEGYEVEMVWADKQPFMAAGIVESRYYDQEFDPIKFTSRRKDVVERKAYMDSKGYVETQNEVANS